MRPPGRRGSAGRAPRTRKGRGRSRSKSCLLLVFAFLALPALILAVIR